MDITQVKQLISDIRKAATDYVDVEVPVGSVDVTSGGRLNFAGVAYAFTSHSYRQWCSRLGIPARFAQKLPHGEGVRASQQAVFDHLKANVVGDVVVRLDRTKKIVRAVLPARYQVFDNDEVLTRLLPFMKETGMVIEDIAHQDGNLNARILHPSVAAIGKLPDGSPDIHKFGYVIRNSEIGTLSDVRAEFLVYRNACTNGMVFSSALLGQRKKQSLLSCSHLSKTEMDLAADLEVSFHRFETMVPRAQTALGDAQGVVLGQEEAERELNRVLDDVNMTSKFDDAVVRELRREPVFTRFGIAQALTAAARELKGRARLLVESTAGNYILTKPKKSSK